MHYVYLLYSKSADKYYIGESADLRRRLTEHNSGKTFSTRSGVPWSLMYYEAYPSKRAAQDREKKLKHHGKGIAEIKKRVRLDE